MFSFPLRHWAAQVILNQDGAIFVHCLNLRLLFSGCWISKFFYFEQPGGAVEFVYGNRIRLFVIALQNSALASYLRDTRCRGSVRCQAESAPFTPMIAGEQKAGGGGT
jgi:hypothetical protein